jgi:hypothetical protein
MKAILFKNNSKPIEIYGITITKGDAFFLAMEPALPIAKGETFQFISKKSPNIGISLQCYILFKGSNYKHLIEIISTDKMQDAYVSRAIYLHST